MSALSFPYCVGTPRAFINMASLYIYLCGDDTTRVFYIYGVVCVKFVNRQIFMYVSSYFTMVPPCLVSCTSIFSLVGPAWAYCPARPLSPPSLRSLHLSFPLLLPLTWFLTVTSCLARLFRWLLSMFYPNFLPSVASLGIVCGSPLLATLCPCFSSSSCSTPPLCSFPFLL